MELGLFELELFELELFELGLLEFKIELMLRLDFEIEPGLLDLIEEIPDIAFDEKTLEELLLS